MVQQLEKNQIIPLEITGLTSEGNGVGHYGPDRFAFFVPNTAPGDRAQVRVVKLLKNYGYGRLEQLDKPSEDRISSSCPVSGQCGGCSLRHISYEAECRIKNGWIQDSLRRLGGFQISMEPFQPSPDPDRYRNKAQYPVGRDESGRIQIGFYAKRSHRIVDSGGCLLHPPVFSEIAQAVGEFLTGHKIEPYDEASGRGLVRHLYIRMGKISGEIMVCLAVNGETLPHAKGFIQELTSKFPTVSSVVLNVNRKKGNVILGDRCVTLWGKDTIRDVLAGVEVELSPLSFYQVNHDSAEKLYQIAGEYAGLSGGEVLLDLYCGAGTIGLSMAGRCGRLIGVEVIPEAVENARENARRSGAHNAEFLCGDADQAAAQLAEKGIRPNVVVLDPPRKGCGAATLEAVASMSPERIVMVSCNPATMARDCRLLEEKGYRMTRIRGVDMFPRTGHVETVVLMIKK